MGVNLRKTFEKIAIAKTKKNKIIHAKTDELFNLTALFKLLHDAKKEKNRRKGIETENLKKSLKKPKKIVETKKTEQKPPEINVEDLVNKKLDELLKKKLEQIQAVEPVQKKEPEEIIIKKPETTEFKSPVYEEESNISEKKEELVKKELKTVDEKFPLITIKRDGEEIVYVWGHVKWVEEKNGLLYYVEEPPMSEQEIKVLRDIKTILERKLDISFKNIRSEEAFEYLRKQTQDIEIKLGIKLSDQQKMKFEYYIYRDFVGLGKIEALMHDQNIEDISCDGFGIPIFIYHRNPKYAGLETNIAFETKDELDSYVLKLSQKTGKSVSIAEPLLDGALPDGSRVQATYGSDIAMRGSNFTIRKFTKDPITPIDEIKFETVDARTLAFLWLAVEHGLSVLISGATATGKTSFLNAVCLFIKPESKIVSIEDTPELRLPHPNWVPEVARRGFGREEYGEVSMFDLLKASLRQRPDYLIVGEVRGAEANVMFQAMATGHAAMGTLHADDISAVYDRLTTQPISLPAAMLENLDLVLFLIITKREGKYVRKLKEIVEVLDYDINSAQIVTNIAFSWDPMKNTFLQHESKILYKIQEKMGVGKERITKELNDRTALLLWLKERDMHRYEDVSKYLKLYYTAKDELMKEISTK